MQLIANLLFLCVVYGALRGLLRGRLITPSVLRLDTRAAATDTLGETQEYIVTLDTGTKTIVHDGYGNVLSTSTRGLSGVTMADQWRLTTDFTGNADPITSNLEQVDTNGFDNIGSGMSESSGIFSFPNTGIYLINAVGTWSLSGDSRFCQIRIETSTDGSAFSAATIGFSHIAQAQSDNTSISAITSFIFDVTDVSTHKVSFRSDVNNASTTTQGNTDANYTHFTFIRLGDT